MSIIQCIGPRRCNGHVRCTYGNSDKQNVIHKFLQESDIEFTFSELCTYTELYSDTDISRWHHDIYVLFKYIIHQWSSKSDTIVNFDAAIVCTVKKMCPMKVLLDIAIIRTSSNKKWSNILES